MRARGLRRFARSFLHAGVGLGYLLRSQPNARIHLAAAAIALLLCWVLEASWDEVALVVLAIGFVLTMEALNTAVEAVVDLAAPERNPRARAAKDVAAAGVLVAAIGAAVVGLAVFGHRLAVLAGWLAR